jgi:hypothetical protein
MNGGIQGGGRGVQLVCAGQNFLAHAQAMLWVLILVLAVEPCLVHAGTLSCDVLVNCQQVGGLQRRWIHGVQKNKYTVMKIPLLAWNYAAR